MKLTFLGATHEVTGSCYLLEACEKNILVDCGMEQGRDVFENQEIPIKPSQIDCVLLTHSHIDHSGKLPLLYKNGFRGKIYATQASCDLCEIMLRDSAHIQEFEAEWRNRKAKRAGQQEYIPLYTMQDAVGAIGLFSPCDYKSYIDVFDGITICLSDVGHLLGSACFEVWAHEGDTKKKIVFSGDIGNIQQPILKDPAYITDADYVVIESTYGNRSHGKKPDYVGEFAKIIEETFERGGNVVIPSFAVGRTQEMLYFLRKIKLEGRIKNHNDFRVFVDSPLAVESTKVFKQNVEDCFDDETKELIDNGINPLSFDGLNLSVTAEDSKAINFDKSSKVIISASGMCDAGRIRHHLKHNLWRKESTILFVGYQAEGTVGRQLLDGAKTVKVFGEAVQVNAKITSLAGVSGHADKDGLLKWASAFGKGVTEFFVTHGDEEACDSLIDAIKTQLNAQATAPYSGECWDLIDNKMLAEGTKNRIERNTKPKQQGQREADDRQEKLIGSIERLKNYAQTLEKTNIKKLDELTIAVNSLIEK